MKHSTRSWVTCAASVTAAYFVFATAQATARSDSYEGSRSLVSLQHAQEVLTIGESVLRLKAFIWRDFMPIGVPDDPNEARAIISDARGLRAIVALTDVNGTPVPPTLHAETVWIVQGVRVWKPDEVEEQKDDASPSIRNFVVRKGPQWQIKSFVDVFVRIADQHGAHFLLVLRHQIIEMSV